MDYATLDDLAEAVQVIDKDKKMYRKYLETPVFKEADYVEKEMKELESFILHIFNQEHESCYRRSRIVWGKKYNDERLFTKRLMENAVVKIIRKMEKGMSKIAERMNL